MSIIFVILLTSFLFIGGMGWDLFHICLVVAGATLITLFEIFIKKKKIRFCESIFPLTIFIGFLTAGFLTTLNIDVSLEFFMLILSGFAILLLSINTPQKYKDSIQLTIILSGIIFFVGFIINFQYGNKSFHSLSLVKFATQQINHSHLGDYFVIVFLISVMEVFKNKMNYVYWVLIVLSVVVFAISLSRAAYVSAVVGLVLILFKNKIKFVNNKYLWALVGLIFFVIFLFASANKSIISSRPYFYQAIKGFVEHPLGVGLGNFYYISNDPMFRANDAVNFSFYTHNIVLEMLVSVGVLSVVFIYWLFESLKFTWQKFKKTGDIFALIFIVLTVNFMFDYTYFIPTMLWIWFGSLGLALKRNG